MGRMSGHTPILRASLFALLVTLASFAQGPKVLAPHKPIAPKVEKPIKWLTPAMPRTMVGGLWMIDANFKSSIYLRNVVETDPVTVTPILYLSNGVKYTLPDVTVEPAGIVIISINEALQKKGISSWATLSGYVELQYKWPWDPFCATVHNVDVAHSLIFTYGLRPTLPLPLHILNPTAKIPTHTMEGMWWKQESNVTGFVALANLSSQSAQASVQVTDKEGKPLSEHNVTVSPHGMKMVALRELATLKDTQGGVRVVSSETTDNLVINGGLEDPAVGYSATLPFALEPVDPSKPVPINIAELGLMAGVADPMMLFPAGTTFTPYSVLRNVSDAPVSVTPTLWWMEGGVPHSARLPRINLLPYQTESLDVMSLLSVSGLKNFNGSFNLVFDGEARLGALVLASGSVDQTNTYVFEVVARGVTESAAKSLQYWSTGNGDDTMVAVWNPADETQDFVFTLFFTGGHYIVPLHLEARATRTFNVSEIVQNQVPDAEGNVIPASVHEGTAKIAGSRAENEHILVGIDSGIYNVRKATCTNNCQECDGYTSASVEVNPFAVGVNGTHQLDFVGTWNTGGQYDIGGSWSSNLTSVATVVSGLVTGVSAGTVTISVMATDEPMGLGYICTGGGGCPVHNFGGGGGGSVFQVTNVIPYNLVLGTSGILTISGQGFQSLTSPIAQFDPSVAITTGTPSVVSDTQMTVSYQVTCSAPLGSIPLQIGSYIDGGILGITWPENVISPSAPAPTIMFGGNNITGTTQNAVVGQQIALSASISAPACTSVSGQTWTPQGTIVGGYDATVTSGNIVVPTLTNQAATFYWAYPGQSIAVTFSYCLITGTCSTAVQATFNVAGPSGGKMTTTHVGTVGITTFSGNTYLQFGTNSSSNAGVLFTPSATAPSGYSNTFIWVQLISNDSIVANGSPCSAGTGLDNIYPYPPVAGTNKAGDSPAVQLLSTDTSVSRTFAAQMYLLWSSGLSNSIPVPLGSTTWNFSGTATKSGSTWSATGSGSAGSFVASNASQSFNGYPTWSTHTTNGVCHSDT